MRFYLRANRRSRVTVGITAVIVAMLSLATIALATQQILSAGPLTRVLVTDQLNCAVSHTGDSSGEFYGDTACGTFVTVGGVLFGPSSVPAGGGASPRTAWTQVSQSAVTGSGTALDPYRIVTVADAGTTGIRVTETDSYTVGQEAYRTDVALSNSGGAGQNVIVYRAADCYLQNSDSGYGRVDAATHAVACTTGTTPTSRIEQWFPLTPGSHYYQAGYYEVWARIGSQLPFPDTCRCSELIDNGAGLSWSLSVPAGGGATVSHFTTFSPLGIAPLSTTKTADAATASPGSGDGYTITVSNPNGTAATLNSITDTLPAGFTYVTGSSSGTTTANPAVSSQTLTWSGPFTVPASGNVTLHFGVTVSTVAGVYQNNAGGDAGNVPVAPSGPTAQITVGTGGAPPPTTTQASAFLVANSTSCGQVTLTATGVTAALLHQFVVTSSAGGTPYVVNATADSSQRITATIDLRSAFGGSGGGTFSAFVRMASNQVTVSNTVTFSAAACVVATPTPTPRAASPTPAATPVVTSKPTPTPAPIAQLPSTATGDDSGLPLLALAAISIAIAAFGWRKRDSRT